jgi:serine/threonine-protein kinase
MSDQIESKIADGTTLLGKYRVIREVGRGGMAAVYEAEQLSLGKKVALKVLAAELAASNVVIERFFREARAAASVKSPHIVDVYDSGRLEDGRPFIAMEMLDGESLYDRMARVRIIDVATTVRVINHCGKGLAKAHAAGIVHRDLKPENIFLTKGEDGEELVKILDFGLAKFYAPVNPDEKTKRLTREGAVFGTPAYMSPEQVKGQGSVDHRSDLWALGCMAYECLLGRPVWNMDQGVAMTFASIATGTIPTPSRIRTDLPLAFDEWFKKCLARDPANRFQSAKELADALAKVFGEAPSLSNLSANALPSMGRFPEDEAAPSSPRIRSGLPLDPLRDVSVPDVLPASADVSITANQPPAGPPEPRGPSLARLAFSGALVVASVSLAAFVWARYLKPQVVVPTVVSTAKAPANGPDAGEGPQSEEPSWGQQVREGQRLLSIGDFVGAQKKFKEALDTTTSVPATRGFVDQTKVAPTGPCKLVGLGRPRTGLGGNEGRPTVAAAGKGALVAWTDDHEQSGRDHTYSVLVDATGRTTSSVRDLTPEATSVVRPTLVQTDDKYVLLYWDQRGHAAGVRVRRLDAEGRIGGASVLVGASRSGMFWPAIERAPMGFFVVWQDDRDREGDDLFVRRLSPELDTLSAETRLTDYVTGPKGKRGASVRYPTVAVGANSLFVAYRLDRDGKQLVYRLRLPLDGPELAKGLGERVDGSKEPRTDRELGNPQLVNEDKVSADVPSMACGTEGCFIAWHGETSGASLARLDVEKGSAVWRKPFAPKGARPTLFSTKTGEVYVSYYEGGRVRVASVNRDGPGPATSFGHIAGDHPRPSIAQGSEKGELWIAWEDAEASGSTFAKEAYVARLTCP